MTTTKFKKGDQVATLKPIERFGGDIPAGRSAKVSAAWLDPIRGELLNLEFAGGSGVSELRADRVERNDPIDLEPLEPMLAPVAELNTTAAAITTPATPKAKPKRASKPKAVATVRRTGGTLWD